MKKKQAGPPPEVFPVLGLLVASIATFLGVGTVIPVWFGLLVAAFITRLPVEGKRDERPSTRILFWYRARLALLGFTSDWIPTYPIRLATLWGVAGGMGAYLLPVIYPGFGWISLVNAACAYVSITGLTGVWRRVGFRPQINPGARTDYLVRDVPARPLLWGGLAIGGLCLGYVLGVFLDVYSQLLRVQMTPLHWVFVLFLGFLIVFGTAWNKESLKQWRKNYKTQAEVNSWWEGLKITPPPEVTDVSEFGQARVITVSGQGVGSDKLLSLAPKISAFTTGGVRIAALPCPDTDQAGQPIPGTTHPTLVRYVIVPGGQLPDITDPSTKPEEAKISIETAFAWALADAGMPPVSLTDIQPLSSSAPVFWEVHWKGPAVDIRTQFAPTAASFLGVDSVTDHREETSWFGTPPEGDIGVNNKGIPLQTHFENLLHEDTWIRNWVATDIFKHNFPTIQHSLRRTVTYQGKEIHVEAFVARHAQGVEEYLGKEKLLSSVLNGAPFVNITGFHTANQRKGERHRLGFQIAWSSTPQPANPLTLTPESGEGPHLILAAIINRAFEAAKIPAPELVKEQCLTSGDSPAHIWYVTLRLYDGVTLADVRAKAEKIRQALAVPYLRINEATDGVDILFGANPEDATLASPALQATIHQLEWEQGMIAAGLTGAGGQAPQLVSSESLPNNQSITELVFKLPTGIDVQRVRANAGKLMTNTGSAFVTVSPTGNGGEVKILASTTDPLPSLVPPNYELLKDPENLFFATGIEGSPIDYDLANDVHLIVVGGAGSGKSIILQDLLIPSVLGGSHTFIADSAKAGADFRIFEPYTHGFATSVEEAARMLEEIYNSYVLPRKELVTQHQVANIGELPFRVPRVIIVIDEFVSMLTPEPVPAGTSEGEFDEEREYIFNLNRTKTMVGSWAAKISREARYVGVHIISATQALKADDMKLIPGGGSFKANASRIIAGKSSYGDKAAALKNPEQAPELGDAPPKGRAIFEKATGSPMVIQTWYESEGQARIARILKEAVQPVPVEEKIDLTPAAVGEVVDLGEMEFTLNDLEDTADSPQPDAEGEAPKEVSKFDLLTGGNA